MTRSAVRGPTDATQVPRYAGPATFARLPRPTRCRRPTSPWSACRSTPASPTARAPASARPHPCVLRLLRPYNPALGREPFGQPGRRCRRHGRQPVRPERGHRADPAAADDVRAAGAKLLTIGGDHTIALPLLRSRPATTARSPSLHFDAHLDTWDTYFGAAVHPRHAVPARQRRGHAGHRALSAHRHPRAAVLQSGPRGRPPTRLPGRPFRRLPKRRRRGDRRPDARPNGRRADLYLHRHRRPRPRPRPGHRHPGSRRLDQPRTAGHPARPRRPEHHRRRHRRGRPPYDHAEITGIAAAHVAYELCSVLACNRRNADPPSTPRRHRQLTPPIQ